MVIKNNGNGDGPVRVTLSVGNWIVLIGMILGQLVAVGSFMLKQENRMTRMESRIESLMYQIDRLDKKP